MDSSTCQIVVKQLKTSDGTVRTTGGMQPVYSGGGAPGPSTLATGAYYRQFSWYVDTTSLSAPNLWMCMTAGDKTSSVWYSFTQC